MEANEIAALESESTGGLEEIKRKTKLIGTVKKITIAGAIVDIGMGVPGVVHISQLQENPTNRVEDVVKVGQMVDVWVKRVDPRKERIELTMIEPLPLEWREIKKGMVVKGKVTRLEKFGAFVDIGAERPGLVHISEMTHGYLRTPEEFVKEGDEVETQVLAVNRRKKQIKLSMKALEEEVVKVTKEEKPSRASKPAEKASSEEPAAEVIPTAMEMALREAMERSNGEISPDQSGQHRKSKSGNVTYDAIFERTLHNKVRTSR